MSDWELVPSLDQREWPTTASDLQIANRRIAEFGRVWPKVSLEDIGKLVGDVLADTSFNCVKISLRLHSESDSCWSARVEILGLSNAAVVIEASHASLFSHWLNKRKLLGPVHVNHRV